MAAPADDGVLTSDFVVVRDLRTHYRHAPSAPPSPVPFVCVHGLAVSHRYLAPLARRLAAHGPVFVPDLPGFGLSAEPPSVFGAAEHAEHVAAWLRRLGLPPACVLGHSFGAEVAAALAANHPDTTAALVLAGPTTDPRARSRFGQVMRFLRDLPGESLLQAPILVRDVWDAGPARVWGTLGRAVNHRVEETLARVTVPTLVLGGAGDPISPARWRDEIAALIPDARQATAPAAAHNVTTTSAAQVAGLVASFARRTGRARGLQKSR